MNNWSVTISSIVAEDHTGACLAIWRPNKDSWNILCVHWAKDISQEERSISQWDSNIAFPNGRCLDRTAIFFSLKTWLQHRCLWQTLHRWTFRGGVITAPDLSMKNFDFTYRIRHLEWTTIQFLEKLVLATCVWFLFDCRGSDSIWVAVSYSMHPKPFIHASATSRQVSMPGVGKCGVGWGTNDEPTGTRD